MLREQGIAYPHKGLLMNEMSVHSELEALAQQVDRLEISPSQEDIAVDILLSLSKKLRSTFSTPAETIKFFLNRWELGDAYLAKVLGSRSRASEILSGKRNLTMSDLRTLRDNLGIPSDLLLGDPKSAENQAIDFGRYPVREMVKHGLIRNGLNKRSRNLEEVIRGFFKQAEFSPELAKQACYRRSIRKNEKSDVFALQVWLAAVRKKSLEMKTYPYEGITADTLKEIAQLSIYPDGPVRAVDALQQKGIHVVVMPHFRGTYLDGAVFIMHNTPVIGLTLRYDRLDNFWHTLLHELSHLCNKDVSEEPVFDDLEISGKEDSQESAADHLAQESFIPLDRWREFCSHRVSTMSICALAAELSLSPAVVAGRYRFESKNYKIFTSLVGHGEVRRLFPNFEEHNDVH